MTKLSAKLFALMLAAVLFGCGNPAIQEAATPTAEAGEQVSPTETEPTEAEIAEARAEFEAQRTKIRDVVESMDRKALIAESSTKGPLDAEVVLLKFSDFECPYCAVAAGEMKEFTKAHEDDVLYVYKQFPLVSIHDEAMPAAKAAWAAGQQDQFWIYHDGLFAFQDKLGEDYYVELAEQIGLDVDAFERDRNSPEAQAAIDKDIKLAESLGLRGTPSFVMNDLLIPGGAPLDLFEEAARRFKAGETF